MIQSKEGFVVEPVLSNVLGVRSIGFCISNENMTQHISFTKDEALQASDFFQTLSDRLKKFNVE